MDPARRPAKWARQSARRWSSVGIAVLVTVVGVAAVRVWRGSPTSVGSDASGPRNPQQPLASGIAGRTPDQRVRMAALAASPAGTIYALTNRCGGCSDREYTLVRSSDQGTTWTVAGPVAGSDATTGDGRLFAADDAHLWAELAQGVFFTADGGRRWRLIHRYPSPMNSEFVHEATAAGTGLWLNVEHKLYRGDLGGALKPIDGPPARAGLINPINTDEAIILLDDGQGAPRRWYTTSDGGAHWTRFADPCTAEPLVQLRAGHDGSRWANCTNTGGTPPDKGPQHHLVSTDDGHTWQPRGTLDFSLSLYPVSSTTCWAVRWPGHIYRSTNGSDWTNVAPSDPAHPTNHFLALDSNTAVAAGTPDEQNVVLIRATRDGGATWTTHPFAPS
jgi:photosystem II stability/assembly factor-like uncharacterized protein